MSIKNKMLLISTLLTILLASCKKNDIDQLTQEEKTNELRFFEINENTNSGILQINKSLREQNQEKSFITKFIKLAGYPKWDKGFFLSKRRLNQRMQSRTTVSDSTYIIPVVSESDRVVTGAIIAKIGDSSTYNLVLLKDYQSYSSDKSIFIKAMMILDAKVYGYNKFKIEDTSAITNTKEVFFSKGSIATGSNKTASTSYDDPCDIIEIWYNPDGDACNCTGDEYYTGEWYYADEENCFSTTPQPVISFLLAEGGGGYQLPVSYYILPDLSGGGGGSNPPPYNPIPTTEQQKTDYLVEQLNLDQTQQFYLVNTTEAIDTLFNYLWGNNTIEARNIAIWAIGYFSQHPNVNMEIFTNQFLGKSEGYEGEYDTYWDNPNLTFPQQNLPSWNDFSNAFPKDTEPLYDTPEKMYNSIGGDVATIYSGPNTNTCAIRLSKALNYSGVTIPNIPGQTYKGADNKYYFKAAYQINIWMRKTFGTNPATSTTPLNTNHYSYNQAQAGVNGVNLPGLLNGKKGIYSIYSSNFQWATGHADLLNPNATCGNNCHFADAPIARLDIWILN
jgi:hypothetical protein